MYSASIDGAIVRVSDGAIIPDDPRNADRRAYLSWLADGNSPSQPPLEDVRSEKKKALNAEFLAALSAGIEHDGHAYQLDESSQQIILSMGATAGFVVAGVTGFEWDPEFRFIDAANNQVPFTAAEFVRFANAARRRVIDIRMAYRSCKDALLAAQDRTALDAVKPDFS